MPGDVPRRTVLAAAVAIPAAAAPGGAGMWPARVSRRGQPSAARRDPLQWPFASTSPWNMPIGSNATYVAINLPSYGPVVSGNFTPVPDIDPEHIVLAPAAPVVSIVHSNGGFGGDRCIAGGSGGGLPISVPIPATYTVPSDATNSSAAFLLADGRTIKTCQPFALCVAGGNGTALAVFTDTDLYTDGIAGAHGGSNLSTAGGAVRMGELRPGQTGMRHAIKIDVNGESVLAPQISQANSWRWPASTADSYWATYGAQNGGQYSGMKMGALLAIPASVDITTLGLASAPGLQLAWTLQNYGAYIVDTYGGADTLSPTAGNAGSGYALCAEDSPAGSKDAEFFADWGYHLHGRINDQTAWTSDFVTCMTSLYLVDNNTVSTVGGGGTPRQPLAPPISP